MSQQARVNRHAMTAISFLHDVGVFTSAIHCVHVTCILPPSFSHPPWPIYWRNRPQENGMVDSIFLDLGLFTSQDATLHKALVRQHLSRGARWSIDSSGNTPPSTLLVHAVRPKNVCFRSAKSVWIHFLLCACCTTSEITVKWQNWHVMWHDARCVNMLHPASTPPFWWMSHKI